MFITFEGIEGTGKTTQIKRLTDHLQSRGRDVLLTREPGGSRIGRELRKMLLHMESTDLCSEAELFLYMADRAQHMAQVINPALEAGQVVISDRFADSTIAYQGYGRSLDPKQLHQFNHVAIQGRWPDLTILLDLDPELGLKRAMTRNLQEGKVNEEGRFEAESLEFHTRVREGYLTWAAIHQERIRVVDAARSPDEVFADVRVLADELLDRLGT